MSLLLLPKQYKDGNILYKTALDAIVNALLNFFNTQKLGGDNVQTGGISAANLSLTAQPVPVGAIVEWPLSVPPNSQWLTCYGQSVAVATYPALFAVIGYTYGGAGANFNLPDLRGRAVAGKSAAPGVLTIVDSTTLGATGGNENLGEHTHADGTLDVATDGEHTHSMFNTDHGHAQIGAIEDAGGTVVGNGRSFSHEAVVIIFNNQAAYTIGNGLAQVGGTINAASSAFSQSAIDAHGHTVDTDLDTQGDGATGAMQPFQITDFIIRVT